MVQEKYKESLTAQEQEQLKATVPDEEEEGGLLATVLYFLVVGLVFSALTSKAITGTWLWNQSDSKWLQRRTWFPVRLSPSCIKRMLAKPTTADTKNIHTRATSAIQWLRSISTSLPSYTRRRVRRIK